MDGLNVYRLPGAEDPHDGVTSLSWVGVPRVVADHTLAAEPSAENVYRLPGLSAADMSAENLADDEPPIANEPGHP